MKKLLLLSLFLIFAGTISADSICIKYEHSAILGYTHFYPTASVTVCGDLDKKTVLQAYLKDSALMFTSGVTNFSPWYHFRLKSEINGVYAVYSSEKKRIATKFSPLEIKEYFNWALLSCLIAILFFPILIAAYRKSVFACRRFPLRYLITALTLINTGPLIYAFVRLHGIDDQVTTLYPATGFLVFYLLFCSLLGVVCIFLSLVAMQLEKKSLFSENAMEASREVLVVILLILAILSFVMIGLMTSSVLISFGAILTFVLLLLSARKLFRYLGKEKTKRPVGRKKIISVGMMVIVSMMLFISSCNCPSQDTFSGKALVVANSAYRDGYAEHYSTVVKLLECKQCTELYVYHSNTAYKEGDTLYVQNDAIVGRY